MKSLQGKVAVVTGAGSGIGRALTLELSRRGCRVAASDIDFDAVRETSRQAVEAGGEVRAYPLDVADRHAVHAHAEAVRKDFKACANLVVNNAGVGLAAPVREMRWEDFEWVMNINFWGVCHGTQAFLPQLIESGDGHVVNVSSLYGMISGPMTSAYNAAKFGVRGYTESLRIEMRGARLPVQVSCVHPGGIRTDIVKRSRVSVGQGDRANFERWFSKMALTSPEQAARIIVGGILANRPRILVGPDAHVLDLFQRVVGIRYQRLAGWLLNPHKALSPQTRPQPPQVAAPPPATRRKTAVRRAGEVHHG